MPRRPNLLFIFTDEQRRDTMSCYGNDFVQAPALNRLASESVVFENAYVTQPVCTPSRSTLMTGLWPHTNGCMENNIPLRRETRTLAEMLPREYRRGYFGKWHLGDEIIAQHGFPEWVSIEDNYRAHYSKKEYLARMSDYHHFLVKRGVQPDATKKGTPIFSRDFAARQREELTKAGFLGEEASRFIREHDRAAGPFALYVNFLEPHMPFHGPLDDMYDPQEVPVGPHFRIPPQNASVMHTALSDAYMQAKSRFGLDLTTEQGMRTLRARYLGLVTMLDRAVGSILGALEESGQADDTIVVFTSDHGDMMGDHGIVAKCVMYEEAVTVPLLVRVPWLGRQQRKVAGRVSHVDVVPTLLDLMGQPIPAELQGVSRRDVMEGKGTLAGNDVVIEWNGSEGFEAAMATLPDEEGNRIGGQPWRTLVGADGWKLNLSPVDRCELYDLNTDPCEMTNLFDRPEHKERVRSMAARIREWQKRTGDTAPLPA